MCAGAAVVYELRHVDTFAHALDLLFERFPCALAILGLQQAHPGVEHFLDRAEQRWLVERLGHPLVDVIEEPVNRTSRCIILCIKRDHKQNI